MLVKSGLRVLTRCTVFSRHASTSAVKVEDFECEATTTRRPSAFRDLTGSQRARLAPDVQIEDMRDERHAVRRLDAAEQERSPHLTLEQRERNYLLSQLNTQLNAPRPKSAALWSALSEVLVYPARVPDMRPPKAPITRRLLPSGDFADLDRRPISLTDSQLRRAFRILTRSRPRTRLGLARVLTVAELIAQKGGRSIMVNPSELLEGSSKSIAIDPSGVDLAAEDWAQLISWLAMYRRDPRRRVELEAAANVFSQVVRRGSFGSDGERQHIYRAMMHAAVENKDINRFADVAQRRIADELPDTARENMLRFVRAHRMEQPTSSLWAMFLGTLSRARLLRLDRRKMWNQMLWHFARTKQIASARQLFQAMQSGTAVDMQTFAPPECGGPHQIEMPPSPDDVTYTIMTRAFAHHGSIREAISTLAASLRVPDTRWSTRSQRFGDVFGYFGVHCLRPSRSGGDYVRPKRNQSEVEKLSAVEWLAVAAAGHPDWNIETLEPIIMAFLRLEPPDSRDVKAGLLYDGAQTAPTAKQLYWLIIALETATDSDSPFIMEIWTLCLNKFGDSEKWTGFHLDDALTERIEHHTRYANLNRIPK